MRTRHDPGLIRQHLAERKSKHLTFAQLTKGSLASLANRKLAGVNRQIKRN
jgi:hypothetical protein